MQPLAVRILAFGWLTAFAVSPPAAFAQTYPVPGPSPDESRGLLTRSAFFVSFARMRTDDPRFSSVEHGRADLDLFGYGRGRANFLVDTELLMGSERRTFDLNHVNVIVETSLSYRLAPMAVAAVFRHESRHVVDREFDRVPAWHTVGARAERRFLTPKSTIDVSLDYARVVQHTFVDYTWTSQLTIRLDRPLRPRAHLFASGSGGFVGVDRSVLNRGPQTGVHAEGGVHFLAERAGVDLFAAFERRIDGYPTSREPSSWFELGFRLRSQ